MILNIKVSSALIHFNKNVLIAFYIVSISLSCNSKVEDQAITIQPKVTYVIEKKPTSNESPPIISFSFDQVDFGRVGQDSMVIITFPFINTGGGDLLIEKVHGSCDCSNFNFPTDTIPSGQKSGITVYLNTANLSGYQKKKIIVVGNFKSSYKVLFIKGHVCPQLHN